MLKFAFAVVIAVSFCGVSHADSFTVSPSEGTAVISTVNSAIASNPLAYIFNLSAQAAYTAGLTNYTEAMLLQGFGNLTAADADFLTAQTDFNTVLTDLKVPASVNFDSLATPEPGTLVLLLLGLVGLVVSRRHKPMPLVAVKAAARFSA
jgi:hypothetical protein